MQNVDPWEATGLIFISDLNAFGKYDRGLFASQFGKAPLQSLPTGLEELSLLNLIVPCSTFPWADLCCCWVLLAIVSEGQVSTDESGKTEPQGTELVLWFLSLHFLSYIQSKNVS